MAVPSWAQPSGPWHRRQHRRVDESWASPSQPRVERVADGVADEVQYHHGDEQGGTRPEDDPGRLLQVAAARVDHAAPGGARRLDAEPQEGQGRLGEDGKGDAQRGQDDERRGGGREAVVAGEAPPRTDWWEGRGQATARPGGR